MNCWTFSHNTNIERVSRLYGSEHEFLNFHDGRSASHTLYIRAVSHWKYYWEGRSPVWVDWISYVLSACLLAAGSKLRTECVFACGSAFYIERWILAPFSDNLATNIRNRRQLGMASTNVRQKSYHDIEITTHPRAVCSILYAWFSISIMTSVHNIQTSYSHRWENRNEVAILVSDISHEVIQHP